MKVFAAVTMMALVSTMLSLSIQFAFAQDFDIQSNGDSSGYIVCDPNCHVSSNSGANNGGSSITDNAQSAYNLTVHIPSHTSDSSTVNISIKTANGYTHQADLSGSGDLLYTFNIPESQGKSVQVCVKSGSSIKNCRTYEATGSDMSVSLPAISSTTAVRHIGPWHGWGGYDAFPGFYGYP